MRLTPAECAIRAFGGVRALARALGLTPTAVAQWHGTRHRWSTSGTIPASKQRLVLSLAKERGLPLTAEDLIEGRDIPDQPTVL